MSKRHTIPILAGLSFIAACNGGLKCGPDTHEEDGLCVADDPSVITITETVQVPVTETTTITNTVTNTITNTNTVTNTITIEVPDEDLDPGNFEPTMVEIQNLVGRGGALGSNGSGETHMHIANMYYRESNGVNWPSALFYCSYTFGVLNADNKNSMPFLAQGWKFLPRTGTRDPGCMHLAFDEEDPDIIYATHHGNLDDGDAFLSGYDLRSTQTDPVNNPTRITVAPLQLPMVQEPGEAYEGLDFENSLIWVTSHENGLAVFDRDTITNEFTRIATYTELENARDIKVIATDTGQGTVYTAFVCDGPSGLVALDVTDPQNIVEISRLPLPGVLVDLSVDQDDGIVYLAAQSGGVLSVDISDPANMLLLDQVVLGTSVVAIDHDHDEEKLYVAAWNDTRVYDTTDPSDLAILGATRKTQQKNYQAGGGDGGERPDITNRVLGVAGKGDYVFSGTWWTPTNFQLHPENRAPFIVLPEKANYLAFPGDLAIGESSQQELVIRNDGNEPLTLFSIWSTNPAFTVEPEQLRIDPGSTGTLTLTFTATIGAGTDQTQTAYGTVTTPTGQEDGLLQIWSDDPSQPIREAYLVGNATGLGIGDRYRNDATLLDGTPWSFDTDALGSVTLVSYFATF